MIKHVRFPILLVTLILSAATVRSSSAQTTVTDSVRMDLKLYTYLNISGIWLNCGAGIYATWPDVRSRVLNVESTYSSYGRVATDSMYVPYGYGEQQSAPESGIVVPDGYFGHNPQLGGARSGPARLGSGSCGKSVAAAAARLAGGGGLLNGKPFRVTEWYATYTIPAGTPIADFEWSQTTGTEVSFDGAFPTSREVEVSGRVPVASYEWNVDGTTYSDAAFTHTFDEPGTYAVTLTVTDDDDQTNSITRDVEVKGVVLEYRVFATENVGVSDTLFMFATIKNTGMDTAEEVKVSRAILRIPSYPDESFQYTNDAESDELRPLADTTFSNVGPDEVVTVYQNFAITKSAEAKDPETGEWLPIPVDWEIDLSNISGTTSDGEEAEIVNLCDKRDCDNVTRIDVQEMDVSVLATRVDGDASEVHSGLTRWIGGPYVKGVFYHLVPPFSATPECNSGCVELEITVEKPDGTPVEGAVVNLSRVLLDSDPAKKSIVTPDQGDGVFCFESKCDTELTLPGTDAEGKQKARFWVPGVTKSVQAFIEAEVTKEGFETTKAEDRIVNILPTPIDFVPTMSQTIEEDMIAIDMIAALQFATTLPDLGAWCTKANDWFAKTTASAYGYKIDGVWKTAVKKGIDKMCGSALAKYIYDEDFALDDEIQLRKDRGNMLKVFQGIVDVLGLYWFQAQFDFSLVGTGTTGLTFSPPFLTHTSALVDAIKEANQAIAKQNFFSGSSVPPTIELGLFEVSHKKENTDNVEALYFSVKTTPDLDPKVDYKKLIDKDYSKSIFLTQEQAISATQTNSSDADQSLTLAPPTGKRNATNDSTFAVGHVLVVDPGIDTEEFVQVLSISESTLGLSLPMKYAHSAGAVVAYADSVAIGPPGQPFSTTGISGIGGVSRTPALTWRLQEPEAGFSVEVATDTLFQNIVQSVSDIDSAGVVLDELDDRTRYYWRVAASNASGQGEWSERYSFFTGRPIGDDLVEALPMTDELDAIRFAWTYGLTAETGEATPTCGSGENSIWYSYDPSASGRVAFDTFVSGFDTQVSVWTGTSHPLTEVACNDDYENGEHPTTIESYVEFDAQAGQRYYIRVSGKSNAAGPLLLELRAPSLVANETPSSTNIDKLDVGTYPNPTRGRTTVVVDLSERSRLTVNVFDLLGRRSAMITDETYPAGRQELTWDARGVPVGLYVVVASTGSEVVSRAVTVVR